MLTSYKAQKAAEKRIIEALEQLGYTDGNKPYKPNKVPYFKDICLDMERAKNRHVRYTLTSADIISRADNTVRSREVMAAIDVFASTQEELCIMEDIEKKFMESGWETDLEQTVTGVDDFHSSLNIYKIISEV